MATMTCDNAAVFLLAGHATVTVRSLKTGSHFTYNITKAKNRNIWFVSVLTGDESYVYVGSMFPGGAFRMTQGSVLQADAPSVQAITYTLRCIYQVKRIPETLEVMHDGRCAQCSRTLTHPESLESGLGPECAKKIGLRRNAIMCEAA